MSYQEPEKKGWMKEPSPNDVLFGRGKATTDHAGNQFFRELIRKHKKDFLASSFHERKRFPQMIVDEIKSGNPPRRFMRQETKTKLWHEVSLKDALIKARQALRGDSHILLDELASERYFTRREESENNKEETRESSATETSTENNISLNRPLFSSNDQKDRKRAADESDEKEKGSWSAFKKYAPFKSNERRDSQLGVTSFGASNDHKRARSTFPEKPPSVCQQKKFSLLFIKISFTI